MALVPIFVVWGKITNSLGSKFVVIAFSFIIHAENPFFIGTWFHGSNPQRKPRKLVPHENGHIHSMSTICWSYSHLLLRYLLNMHSINSPILQSPGGIIIYGALWLFDEDFVHVVSITFSALILTELLMVALTIRTWHYLMIIAEVFSLSIYIVSLVVLKTYFGKSNVYGISNKILCPGLNDCGHIVYILSVCCQLCYKFWTLWYLWNEL